MAIEEKDTTGEIQRPWRTGGGGGQFNRRTDGNKRPERQQARRAVFCNQRGVARAVRVQAQCGAWCARSMVAAQRV